MERETTTSEYLKQETATGNCLTRIFIDPFSNCMNRFLSWCAVKTGILCETCHLSSLEKNENNR